MKKTCLAILLACFGFVTAFAQSRTVKGQILDSSTGEPVIGAAVKVVGTTTGTVTDIDGNFSVSAAKNQVLEISYVGYQSQRISASQEVLKTIMLAEDAKILDDMVVIGYGVQKKADLTGSVANVKADDLNTQSNVNIGQALQGKIAGVDIVSMGGAPGAGTKIMVRGIGTLNNATPLYIVDGMYMSSIDAINPSDIESIDVLKDASSAAIYGSRAANGVIIVTTKSGRDTESKPQFNFSANMGISNVTKKLDMMNAAEWSKINTAARAAAGNGPAAMAENISSKEDNDWQDIMFQTAIMQNYNFSVRGGGKYSTYYNSIGYTKQDGTVKGTEYERFTAQSKTDYKKGVFSTGYNVTFSYDNDIPQYGGVRGGMIGRILHQPPTLAKYDPSKAGGYGGTYGDALNLENPLGLIDKKINDRNRDNTKVFANAYFQLEPIKGLKVKFSATPDFSFYRYNQFEGTYDFGLANNPITKATEQQTRTRNILTESTVSYDNTFGKHKIQAVAGYSFQDSQYRFLSGYGEAMPAGIKEIDAAASGRSVSGNSWHSALASVLGRVFYSYDNRYLITATLRRDGSSKFAKDNRWGNFPSVSVGWNVSEEKFMKSLDWLDQLKVRAGYGVLGNQEIANYQYVATITTGINYSNGNGGVIQGAFPKNFANPAVRWEETGMTNVGIDFLALGNRLSLTADYYVKNTKDILLNVPIPISTGGANDPVKNAGEIKNQGFEFNLGWNDQLDNGIRYSINAIGAANKNEVVKMGSDSQEITSGVIHGGTWTSKTLAGYPIGGFWLIPTDGYFNSQAEVDAYTKDGKKIQPSAVPGDIRFKDTNNDGVINDNDRVYSGSPFAKFTYSLNGTIAYKGWDAAITLQGVAGNKIFNATRAELEDVTNSTNLLRSCLNYWSESNHNASVPRLTANDTNRNGRTESTRFLENGDYLRLRTIQIGYSLPKNTIPGIENARVYVSGDNLFTITSYKGYTPDVNASNVHSRGLDEMIYPSNRTFMLGVNVTF